MRRMLLRLATSVLSLVLVLAAGCNRNPSHSADIDYSSLRRKVIDEVASGALKEDSVGKLALPEDLKAASVGGVAFVSREQPAGLLIVFLNTAPASDAKEHGVLYGTADVAISSPTIVVGGMQWHIDASVEQRVWTVTRI